MSNAEPNSHSTSVDIASQALDVLGIQSASVHRIDVIGENPWGTGGFRVYLADGSTRILKAKRTGDSKGNPEGARREALFYGMLAERMPVRVPRVDAVCLDKKQITAVLMEDCPAAPPLEGWTRDHFLRAAEDLARFHAALWNRGDELRALGFSGTPSFIEAEDMPQHARLCWNHLAGKAHFKDILTTERLQIIDKRIDSVAATQAHLEALPETLIHGDCHIGNVRQDGTGVFVWTDWQGVRIGRGPEDIAFMYLRVNHPDGRVPLDNMLIVYHQKLGKSLGQDVPMNRIRLAAAAYEWSVRLLQMPHYLDGASAGHLQTELRRIDSLAEALGIR